MSGYDPDHAPSPEKWLALDEDERIDLVIRYHRRARVLLPNARIHAVFHVVVETQAAMGGEIRVRQTLERLQAEGLSRHDAVHAVGSVLMKHMQGQLAVGHPAGDPNAAYWAELAELTADGWRLSR